MVGMDDGNSSHSRWMEDPAAVLPRLCGVLPLVLATQAAGATVNEDQPQLCVSYKQQGNPFRRQHDR